MAKKKRSQRKRNLAYAKRQAAKQQPQVSDKKVEPAPVPEDKKPDQSTAVSDAKLSYLRQDLRKIMILASACIGLEIVLWLLLQHTNFGIKVFGI
jgi:hypothetical protein